MHRRILFPSPHWKPSRARLAIGLLALVCLLLPANLGAEETVTFRGEYVWDLDGHQNQVEAVFTSTGEGTWDVTFDFDYARREGTYEGTAKGSLQNGTIEAEVNDAGGTLRYRVEAEIEGDRLEGRHFDIYRGRKKVGGTLRLERVEK